MTRKTFIVAVASFLLGMAAGKVCFGQARVPAYAASLALEQQQHFDPRYFKYLWNPSGSVETYATAVVAINVALNLSSNVYQPPQLAGGALIGVDLTQLADNAEQLNRVEHNWLSLAPGDAYFNYTVQKVIPGDKKNPSHKEAVTVAAPWLGEGQVVGVGSIFRVDQFCAVSLASVDGGRYLKFRGLEVGKTKLADYLKSRGLDLKEAEKQGAIDQVVTLSNVTSRVRVIKFAQSQGVKPSHGRPLVSITNDLAQSANDPNRNGFQSLLNESFDAFEVIITLPNGQQEFTLWNGKGELLSEAAPNVATDSTIPSPFNARLQAAIGCIRCHGPHEGYQPFQSQLPLVLADVGRFKADLSKGINKSFDALAIIRSRYGAKQTEIDGFLADSRDGLARTYDFVNLKEPHAAKFAYEATSTVYNRYALAWVTPKVACEELGFVPGDKPMEVLKGIMPPPDPSGAIPEGSAGIANRLLAGLSVTREEFESAFPDLITKAMAAHEKANKQAAVNWLTPQKQKAKL